MDIFWARVLLTFVLGGLVVSGVTVLGERLGTKLGGLVGTLPHLIIIAFYFIGLTQGADLAAQAAVSVPITMGINAIFLYAYFLVSTWNRYMAPVVSLLAWTVMTAPIVLLGFEDLYLSIVMYAVLVPVAYLLFERRTDLPSRSVPRMRYTAGLLAARGVLAGGVIALAVVLARFSGPILGGIFSVFPALFLSTMLIYTFEHDTYYAGAMGKTMSVGGTSVLAFALSCHFLYPVVGLDLGTLLGFLVSVATAVALFPIVRRMK